MIPFPGESIGCFDAWSSDARGWNLYRDIHLREIDGFGTVSPGYRTISSGIEWRCWAYSSDRPYLEAADDAMPLEVRWVIEVLGGTGTLELTDFHDDDWIYDTGFALPNAVGTINVTGAGTYTLPTTSFGNPVIRQAGWEMGPPEVRIVCTSGSVDVQQVKLRAWPVGGAAGYWSEETVTQDPQDVYPDTWRQPIGTPSVGPFTDQATFRANLAAATTSAHSVVTSSSFGGGSWGITAGMTAVDATPDIVDGNFSCSYYRMARGGYDGPAGAEGTDWIRPPEEVQEEKPHHLFQSSGGAPDTVSWVQGAVTTVMSATHVETGPPAVYHHGDGDFHVAIEAVADFAASGASAYSMASGTTFAVESPGSVSTPVPPEHLTLPLPAPGQLYRMVLWHDGHVADVALSGGSTIEAYRGYTADPGVEAPLPLRASWTPAPYQFWDPDALPPEPFEPEVPAGYFLDPNANLDGLGDGVVVTFVPPRM